MLLEGSFIGERAPLGTGGEERFVKPRKTQVPATFVTTTVAGTNSYKDNDGNYPKASNVHETCP